MTEPRVDVFKNFVVARHVITSDRFLVHREDALKLGSSEKICVYEAEPVGYMEPEGVARKGSYVHRFRVYLANYLELNL